MFHFELLDVKVFILLFINSTQITQYKKLNSILDNCIRPFVYIQDREYGHIQMHNHVEPIPSTISATFYTDIPENGGDFKFYMGSGFGELHQFKPEINKLYMFPGWLFHSQTPQEDEKPRICVNLDYCSTMRPKVKERDWIIW